MNTDACEQYVITNPCAPLFACTWQQQPLSILFIRWKFCLRVRHWMQDKGKAESLIEQCQKAISGDDEASFRKLVPQLEDCIDKQKLRAMAGFRWTGMSVENAREWIIRVIDEETFQARGRQQGRWRVVLLWMAKWWRTISPMRKKHKTMKTKAETMKTVLGK